MTDLHLQNQPSLPPDDDDDADLFTLQQLLDLLIARPSWTLAAPLTLSTETDCGSTGVLRSSARCVSALHYYYSLYNLHFVAKLKAM